MPMHVLHICGVCVVGLMTIMAIAATASPWTKATTTNILGDTIVVKYSLWGATAKGSGLDKSESWSDMLDNDEPYCTGSSTPTHRDVLSKYRVAQAGAILAIFGSMAFGLTGLVYGMGKIAKKIVLFIPAGLTWVFAMMCYGGYTSAYNTCDKNLCESFVDRNAQQGSASCGPDAGVWLVWAAAALGVGAFVLFVMRNNGATAPPPANNAAIAQPMNATAYPAPQQQAAYAAYPGQQQQPQQGAYQGQQQQPQVYAAQPVGGPQPYPGMQQQQGGYPGVEQQPYSSNGPCSPA